ncbi:heterogeneous nuclear [Trichuris trichiura]|uniref:Heterogeneous nuclear n=1 Tax=Trichuris trichiura TaxID=36087 RepID=A0A077Z778_TRITR|nr:heterogeneous nuclear [Trichuris trichiura]
MDDSTHDISENIVRVRGLPWSSKEEDIRKFFHDCTSLEDIHFTYSKEGRPSGEAYLEFKKTDDVSRALSHHREHMGQRYIEVFHAKRNEMEYVLQRSGKPCPGNAADNVVRLRGLPYDCTKADLFLLANSFSGLELAGEGIVFGVDKAGRASGEGFARFKSKEATEKALDLHMEKIGHRYIEVFRSSIEEMDRVTKRPMVMMGTYGRSGSGRPGPYSLLESPIAEPGFGREPSRGYYDSGHYRGGPGSMYSNDLYSGGPGIESSRGYYNHQGADIFGRMQGWGVGQTIHMRGLPYKATANDIMEFFYPIKILNVRILFDERGRATGEADVEFSSPNDAREAMNKDRQHMGDRYIELFIKSSHVTPVRVKAKLKYSDNEHSRPLLPRYGTSMNPMLEPRSLRTGVIIYPGLSQFSGGGPPDQYHSGLGTAELTMGGHIYQSPC